MALEDLRDRVKESVQAQWSQFQETSFFQQAKESYENLTPSAQLLAKIVAGFLVSAIAVLPPLLWYVGSMSNVSEFVSRRALLKDVLRVIKQMGETPTLIPQFSDADVKSKVQEVLGTFQFLPEQLKETTESNFETSSGGMIPKSLLQRGVTVRLHKLNVRQIIDLGFRLQTLPEGMKVTVMETERSPGESHYYDVHFRVVSFALAESGAKTAPPLPAAPKGSKKAGG